YSVKYMQTTKYETLAIRFQPETPIDLSNYTHLVLRVKAYNGSSIVILLATDGSNYFATPNLPIVNGKWMELKIPLTSLRVLSGNPVLNRITYMTIYLKGVKANNTYTILFDGLYAYKEEYVIRG
ncbi:MAG: CIA30 family protein, partial [archaeon GB-1845-036]|nr:CIA30 family protein [Candidatus Culexmicrobium thermophilum]